MEVSSAGRLALFFGLAVAAGGCGAAAPGAARAASGVERAPVVLDEVRITNAPPMDVEKTFAEAKAHLLKNENVEAAALFDKIVKYDPAGPAIVPGLFNAGIAYHGQLKLDEALERFVASAQRGPSAPTTKDAYLWMTRIHGEKEQWVELEKLASQILARTDLTVLEHVEALGAKGLGLVEQGRVEEAKTVIFKARDIIEDHKLGQSGVPPVELAQVAFALGEIRRIEGEKLKFVPFPPNFAVVLEDRCTQLLDAQYAYQDAMRSQDAHWGAMAGFRLGELYHQLHRDVMEIPLPANAKTIRQKQLWEGAMRMRYRVLLEKGLKAMNATVDMAERTGEGSAWVTRARAAKKELEQAIAIEKEALAKLPVSEEDLKGALEDLRSKAQPVPPKPGAAPR